MQKFEFIGHRQADGSTPTIGNYQIFGERCSGTNYVHRLVNHNLKIQYKPVYGWKHGFPQMAATRTDSIAIVVFRHPEVWLQSLYKNPWHVMPKNRRLPFSDFIRTEWHTIVDKGHHFELDDDNLTGRPLQFDRHPISGKYFSNILQLRNAKNQGFLSMLERFENCILVRYEDVVKSSKDFIEIVSESFGIKRENNFNEIINYKGWKTGEVFKAKKYETLPEDDLNFIWSELNGDCEKRLGYFATKAP